MFSFAASPSDRVLREPLIKQVIPSGSMPIGADDAPASGLRPVRVGVWSGWNRILQGTASKEPERRLPHRPFPIPVAVGRNPPNLRLDAALQGRSVPSPERVPSCPAPQCRETGEAFPLRAPSYRRSPPLIPLLPCIDSDNRLW